MRKYAYLIILIAFILLYINTLPEKGQEIKVLIDGTEFRLSVANNDEKKMKGLANIRNLNDHEGMLFSYNEKGIRHFWMKDVLIPLQILFIKDCEIVEIQEMKVEDNPSNPKKTYSSSSNVDQAIELKAFSVSNEVIGQTIEELCE